MTKTDNDVQVTETERAVAEMMVENTGTHMLDSGGSMGRSWQRNQKAATEHGFDLNDPDGLARYFKSRPEGKIDFSPPLKVYYDNNFKNGIRPAEINYVTVDVFHWITGDDMSSGSERFTYLPDEDAAFVAWTEAQDKDKDRWEQMTWFEAITRYLDNIVGEEYERGSRSHPMEGGSSSWMVGYTYNEENVLSQDIHWWYWRNAEGDERFALSLHNGADARGGFTRPRIFEGSIEYGAVEWSSATIYCGNRDCRFYNEIGDRFGDEGDNPRLMVGYREEPEVVFLDRNDPIDVAKRKLDVEMHERAMIAFRGSMDPLKPVVWYEQTGKYEYDLFCPLCEKGRLGVAAA